MTDETELPRCEICGEPMPEGETMFKFHGFSGPCPAPPLPRPAAINWQTSYERALARIAELEAAQVDKTSNPQGRLVDNTADLQARVDGLEEALAERTRERDEARRLYQTTYERLKAERDAAIKRAEAAEEDAERLDWLAANPREATVRVGGDMKIAVFWGVSAAPGTTMRAAIDAAMKD